MCLIYIYIKYIFIHLLKMKILQENSIKLHTNRTYGKKTMKIIIFMLVIITCSYYIVEISETYILIE